MLEKEGELERIRDRKAKGGGGGGHRRAGVEEDHLMRGAIKGDEGRNQTLSSR